MEQKSFRHACQRLAPRGSEAKQRRRIHVSESSEEPELGALERVGLLKEFRLAGIVLRRYLEPGAPMLPTTAE